MQAHRYESLFLLRSSLKNILPWGFLTFLSKWLGIFRPNFTHLLYISIYWTTFFIQLSAILTKLCRINRDHSVHNILCLKCRLSAETRVGIFWHFRKTGIFDPNSTYLLHVPIYARLQIFIHYLQLWRSYAILSTTTQRTFQPMVDILSIYIPCLKKLCSLSVKCE